MLVLVFDIACSVFGLWPDPRKLSHCPRELILCLWALSCCSLLSITIVISIVGLRGKDWRHWSAAVVDCSVARSSICSFQQCRRDSRIPLRASYSMSVMIIINNNNVGGQYLWTRQLANILPVWEERSPRRQAMRGKELFCLQRVSVLVHRYNAVLLHLASPWQHGLIVCTQFWIFFGLFYNFSREHIPRVKKWSMSVEISYAVSPILLYLDSLQTVKRQTGTVRVVV